VKERVAAAQRGQRFQVQKWVQDLMNPDILGQIDPAGRRQEGAAWKGRSEGCNRDFLALGGWCRGGTAGTSGSAGFRHGDVMKIVCLGPILPSNPLFESRRQIP